MLPVVVHERAYKNVDTALAIFDLHPIHYLVL